MDYQELKRLLLVASDTQLDASMKLLIQQWTDPPEPLEILQVLDKCIFGSLSSDFIVLILQVIYDGRLRDKGVVHDDVIKGAYWRDVALNW